MITVVMALALQATWPADRPDNGWTRRGMTTDGTALLLTKPGPRAGMVWTRQELREPDPKFQTYSTITLVEADCTGRRSRTIQGTDWTGKNATGTSVTWEGSQWRYPLPGSLGETIMIYACGELGD